MFSNTVIILFISPRSTASGERIYIKFFTMPKQIKSLKSTGVLSLFCFSRLRYGAIFIMQIILKKQKIF
jgi:hypothetical protein